MDIIKKINEVWTLYSQGKFSDAQKINNEILENDSKNIYAIRYKRILAEKVKKDKKNLWVRVKWKILKCPHCLAKIPISALSVTKRVKIKRQWYNNLQITCPYCSTEFVLQKRTMSSILGLKIGEIAIIEWKKYRTTGCVKYVWKWYDWQYSWDTRFLEWLLLGEDNNYYYFSEWKSYTQDWIEQEFELSRKVTPEFSLSPEYSNMKVKIWWVMKNFSWRTEAKVEKVYGENSKKYQIWEITQLFEFNHSWKKYVIEKEWVGSQMEAGIYETKNLSKSQAWKIFDKNVSEWSSIAKIWKKIPRFVLYPFIWIPAFLMLVSNNWYIFSTFLFLLGVGLSVGILVYYFKKDWSLLKILMLWLWGYIIAQFLFAPIFNLFLESKNHVTISEITQSKKYESEFSNTELSTTEETGRTSYEHGWIRTSYKQNIWLKFSVRDSKDQEVLEYITKQINNWETSELTKIFTEKIYKIK
jgi:hypothetical protein